mgnify:CR=1 FL=1
MSSITFSTLDSLPGPDLLDLLRRYAKANKKADPVGKALSWHQDQVAISLGFKNWSMLHKHLASANWSAVDQLKTLALKKPDLGEFVEEHAYKTIDEDDAAETMRQWARAKYSRLIDFAFYDNESETGFSWPAVEMVMELGEEFSGRYPQVLIEKVGWDLEVDGPWGLELSESEIE